MPQTYSLHKIDNEHSFPFKPADYSRFKFGDDLIAERFGVALAQGFIKTHLAVNKVDKQLVVISSPYAFIPTATFALKNYFVYELNKWLTANDLPVAEETKIHRTITYKEDYGELNAEERMKLIGNDNFHIDSAFLKDKTLIFLDDIKITGSHERVILKMNQQYGLLNDAFFLYFAEMTNKSIHPNIENRLNYDRVKSIFDLNTIIKNERFAINTRIVKYILNGDTDAFQTFIQGHKPHFLNLLYNMALGNSYHTIDVYQPNLNILKSHIQFVAEPETANCH